MFINSAQSTSKTLPKTLLNLPKIKLPQKPFYQKITQDIDFYELFENIQNQYKNCYLMESLGSESNERYSIIGFDPDIILSARGNQLKFEVVRTDCIDGDFEKNQTYTFETKNPYFVLRQIVPQNILAKKYAGGLVGFLSFEAINYFEPSLNLPEHSDFEAFKFGVYTDGLVYDKMTGEVFYFYYHQNRSNLLTQFLTQNLKKIDLNSEIQNAKNIENPLKVKFLGHSLSQEEHKKIVLETLEEIKKGNSFQCEVGFKSKYLIEGDKIQIYKLLRKVNPSPFMYFCKFEEQTILGASPEILFRLEGFSMQTSPLAGTTKRGQNEQEDTELARKLLNNPKEIAEHNMLVDMHRNDMGKVSKFGTVAVAKYMEIKKFSHVQHISSDIVGILKNGEDMFSALASNFPAGTLSGAPKVETIKIIHKNEKEPRGVYGGAFGQFGFNGNCNFTIPIRSLFICKNEAYIQTSGGIVYDSNPQDEYQEILNKLFAMEKVLSYFSSTTLFIPE